MYVLMCVLDTTDSDRSGDCLSGGGRLNSDRHVCKCNGRMAPWFPGMSGGVHGSQMAAPGAELSNGETNRCFDIFFFLIVTVVSGK